MFKFFNKIRRKLLDNGRLKKFLVYAISEIFLVVVGILIAIQINNWNEDQKNQRQEFNYILQINKEFKENKIILDKTISSHRDVLKNCESIIATFPINKEKTNLDSISKWVSKIWGYRSFRPSQNAINSLINLSSFQNMKNKNLKEALDSWNIAFPPYHEVENIAIDFLLDEFSPYLNNNFNYYFDLTDPRTNLDLLTTFKFENLIKEREYRQNTILKEYNLLYNLQNSINKIIELTDKEIKENDN